MLSYLLDEHISFVVSEQLKKKNPEMSVESVYLLRGGSLAGQRDSVVLRAASAAGLCLVTYDLKTIPPLLAEMSADQEDHAGVLFVDDATLRNSDFGGLVNALLAHWVWYGNEAWTNRIAFLTAA